MTKVTILGEEPQKKELKKIEFVKEIWDSEGMDLIFREPKITPSDYDNITLIKPKCNGVPLDLMLAWDNVFNNKSKNRGVYFGHFNDGVV